MSTKISYTTVEHAENICGPMKLAVVHNHPPRAHSESGKALYTFLYKSDQTKNAKTMAVQGFCDLKKYIKNYPRL